MRMASRLSGDLWKRIRLELAGSPEFPDGSASRAYMLCLPLDGDGMINDGELHAAPRMATIRRYWPSQPDRAGYVQREGDGWRFSCFPVVGPEGRRIHLENRPLCLGELVTLTEPDGSRLLFRVQWVVSSPSIERNPGHERKS